VQHQPSRVSSQQSFHPGFLNQCAIGSIIRHALQRTGTQAPTTGADQFRHTLATHRAAKQLGEGLYRSPPDVFFLSNEIIAQAAGGDQILRSPIFDPARACGTPPN
jgi:hypothetical protein